MPIDIECNLFEKLVFPILLYGCEIWGFHCVNMLETFYRKFLKKILHLRPSTPSCMVYGEVGKLPLQVTVDKHMINYWIRLLNKDSTSYASIIYTITLKLFISGEYKTQWLSRVKCILDNCGLSYIWLNQKRIDKSECKSIIHKMIEDIYNINNTLVTDSEVIANEFNNFFVSIGPTLASNITCSKDPLTYVNGIANSIVVPNVICMDVRTVISSLKNSCPGFDGIPSFVANQCIDNFIEPLTYIINMSFMEGVLPSELKLAKVVPIFKSGDSTKMSNYRPISILSFFSKIFEKLTYNIVNNFLYKNDIIYKYQFGFRKKHSTQHAIITLVDRITSSLDSGDLVIGVFLYLKKAFDTVDHQILTKKLFSYGIRGNTLKWFQSYLTDRSQYVTYDGIESKVLPIKYGVPQGSILGPLLFIIYMNDIFNVSNFPFTILYADDTCVTLDGKSLENLITLMNQELHLLYIWLQSNKLTLNVQKTYYIIFHRARLKLHNTTIDLQMGDYNLNKANNL